MYDLSPGKHIRFYEAQILFIGTYAACLEKFSEFGSQLVKEEDESKCQKNSNFSNSKKNFIEFFYFSENLVLI